MRSAVACSTSRVLAATSRSAAISPAAFTARPRPWRRGCRKVNDRVPTLGEAGPASGGAIRSISTAGVTDSPERNSWETSSELCRIRDSLILVSVNGTFDSS
jgi:hypothetical protein